MDTKVEMLKDIQRNNFSESFIDHMRNAMMMSYFKHQDKRGDGNINNYVGMCSIDMIQRELDAFASDGNTEHMVNIANYAMIRFMFPQNNESYVPTDSDKSTFVGTKEQSVFDHIRDHIFEYC